jgi:hypothetical protein
VLLDYMAVGANEIWNTPRLQAYLTNVASPFTSGSSLCGCDTLTAAMLDDPTDAETPPYTTPTADPAPWFDTDLPESANFLGFLPLTVTGIDDNPRARNITNTVGGGGVFGPVRDLPRTVTVTGLLIGTSCCGAEFGIHYLSEALAGCTGGACDGECVTMYNCCPDAPMTRDAFNAQHRRTFRRGALISGPTVTGRTGTGTCARGTCGANGDIIEVEFVLSFAVPWAWTDQIDLLDVNFPIGGTGPCVAWCLSPCPTGDCLFAPCSTAADTCSDPLRVIPTPPSPTIPTASFCIPLAPERTCFSIDLSTRPLWSSDVPMITVSAGSTDLRNVRITIYEKPAGTTQTCDQIADANRCSPLMEFFITFLPANNSIQIDGQTGQVTTDCGGQCEVASTAFGSSDGGPVKFADMTCAGYCVCLESDVVHPPSATAGISFGVSGRGY